jgi:hypothetical protein
VSGTYSLTDLVERFKSLFVRVYATEAPRADPLRHTTASMEVEMADADVTITITKRPKVRVGTQAEIKAP